jgi:hypothetical protein
MKRLNTLILLSPIILVMFLFTSCDMDENPVGTFGEAVERVPNVQLIEGADNVTMKVQYNRDYSYFRVTLSNTGNSSFISDGTYNSWCLQMELPMEVNREYTGVKLFATDKDRTLNRLSYIVNNRTMYEKENPGLSWKDIQVAFWVILETIDMRLESLVDVLPTSVAGYNADIVKFIINDVKSNGMNFQPKFGDIKIVLTDANDNDQSNGVEVCETAFGGDYPGAGAAWWYYFDTEGQETQAIYAGQQLTNGSVTYSGGNLTIDLGDWCLDPGDLDNEQVKILGYDVLPASRPPAGAGNPNQIYAGNELTVPVAPFRYYVIHLDVCLCE